jgi:predicted transcriptional regulator
MPRHERSSVLTLRVPASLDRLIERAARRVRRTKSAVMRDALQNAFGDDSPPEDPAREARRQSLLASGMVADGEVLDFIEHAADEDGWK